MNAYVQKNIQKMYYAWFLEKSCKTSAFLSLPTFLQPGFGVCHTQKFVTYTSFDQVQFFAASTICRIASAQVRKLGKQNKDATWEGVG